MSLAFDFKLTPAQTKALVIICSYRYKLEDGVPDLPELESSYFVTTYGTLRNKGLVSHDPRRRPTWQPTEQGEAVASLILMNCQNLIALAENTKARRAAFFRKATVKA